jgi:hypothetical protein
MVMKEALPECNGGERAFLFWWFLRAPAALSVAAFFAFFFFLLWRTSRRLLMERRGGGSNVISMILVESIDIYPFAALMWWTCALRPRVLQICCC